jgi:hypothetical protein
MQMFVVLRSGPYTETVDGVVTKGTQIAVIAIRSSQAEADAVAAQSKPGPNWGPCVTWVDGAVVDAEPMEL